jgi:hypothetical protein
MKLIHDPNYRLKKYQDKVKAQQAKAASEAEYV